MSPLQPPVAVVDLKNHFVRWEDRRVVHRDKLFHRSIHVLLLDRSGRLVLQRRHRDKLTFPGHWDLSCSGHVEEIDYPAGPDERLDEVYAATARREVGEELGVAPALAFAGAYPPEPGVHYEHIHLFRGVCDGPFVLQTEEVAEVRHVWPGELPALVFHGGPERPTRTLRFFATVLLGVTP